MKTALALAAALLATQARAQQPAPSPSPDPDAPRYREVVEVQGDLPAVPGPAVGVSKVALDLQETPVSVSVVPATIIDSQRAIVLTDALRNVSGVNTASGNGVFDFFTVRGFDSLSSGLVLTDGAPEPESTFYPLYNVSQVEVLKGPTAILYGGNPLAGAVHLVRKQPQPKRFADVSLSYGRFGTFEGMLDANAASADGKLAFRVNGLATETDSFRDGREGKMRAVNPTLAWRPDAGTRVAVSFEYVQSDFAPDSGIPLLNGALPDVPRERSYQSPFDVSDQDVYRLRLDASRQLSDRVSLRNKVYYTDLKWASEGTLIVGAFEIPGFATLAARTLPLLADRQKWLGDQLELTADFATGSAQHTLLAGIEVSRLSDEFTLDVALLPEIDVFRPQETATQPLSFIPGQSQAGDARTTVVAPYLMDRIDFGRVQVLAGARLDSLSFEETLVPTDRDATKLSPLGGIVFEAAPGLSLYANAGSAFGPPSSLVVGEREPEESRQVELGLKKTFLGGKAFLTAAAYHLEKENIAIPDATGVTRQTGDQRARGFELEVQAEAQPGWFATASYAYTDAELTSFSEAIFLPQPPFLVVRDHSGNRPAWAPRHLANAWVVKSLPGGFSLGAGARYVGEQFIAEDNAFAVDGYLLVDAMAAYRRGRFKGSVHFKNLTDREYVTRGFGGASVIPASPLAVYGRIEIGVGSR
ncbi:MAG: TonB-dependent siderophore receptor [Vicinamibacteria bacterium]